MHVQTVTGMAHSGRIYQYRNRDEANSAAETFAAHFKNVKVFDRVYVVVWND